MRYLPLLLILGILNALIIVDLYSFLGLHVFRAGLEWFAGPFSIILFLGYVLIEIPLASLVAVLLLRFFRKAWRPSVLSFMGTAMLFTALGVGVNIVAVRARQLWAEWRNPIEVGVKQYDFSQPVRFNLRDSMKQSLSIEHRTIMWVEHTRKVPPYPDNVWEIFLFEFDPTASEGTITQVTDFEHTGGWSVYSREKSPAGARFFDGNLYWVQEGDLYRYDPGAQESVLVVNNVRGVIGTVEDRLVLRRGDDAHVLYDPATREETRLVFPDMVDGSVHVNGSEMCYVSTRGRLMHVDLMARDHEQLVPIEIDPQVAPQVAPGEGRGQWHTTSIRTSPSGRKRTFAPYQLQILDCENPYVVYTGHFQQPGEPAAVELRVARVDQQEVVFRHAFPDRSIGDHGLTLSEALVEGKLDGDALYYSSNSVQGIMRKDLAEGEAIMVVSESELGDWDVDGDYLVYGKRTGQYSSSLYVQSIPRQ